jgi:hypothetical protein
VRFRAVLAASAAILALGFVAFAWTLPAETSGAQQDALHNCPQPGQYAISVWEGEETETGEALDTCGAGAIDAAYYIEPSTQAWRVFFRDQPAVSDLDSLNDLQAVVTIGGPTASPPPAEQPAPGPSPGRIVSCPLTGKWAMSVWNGPNRTHPADAFATCDKVVAVAYWLDPETQAWQRYVHDRPDLTTLLHLDNLQGVLTLALEAPTEYCALNIPATYHGEATIDGQPAPEGTVIKVFRSGVEFGSTTVGDDGTYTVKVPSPPPTSPPCFESTFGPLTFTCDGAQAQETPSWGVGLRLQDLTCVHMRNCPAAGKWSIAVWGGTNGTEAEQALATCGEGAVSAAYHLDPQTLVWSRWFAGRPEISNLAALDNMQGVIALGGAGAPPLAAPGSSARQGAIQNCPPQHKWAISAWSGSGGADTTEALATCGEGAVALAYSIDPDTQAWSRWVADRPDISNLTTLNNMQGIVALGGTTTSP